MTTFLLALLLAGCPAEPVDSAVPACQDPASIVRSEGYFHAWFPGEDRIGGEGEVVPSDRWTVREGDRLQVEWPDPLIESGVGQVDGFPTFTPVLIPFSAPLDDSSLTQDRFLLFRFDRGDVESLPFHLHHVEDEDLVYLAPQGLLPEGAWIGVAVFEGVTSAEGEPLERPAAMDCLLDGWEDEDHALLGEGADQAMAALQAAGHDPTDIAWLNSFHTASPNERLLRLGRAHDDALASGEMSGTFTHVLEATTEDGTLTTEVKALLPADVQPSGAYPYVETFVQGHIHLPDAAWVLDPDGLQEPGDAESLPFTLLVPPLDEGGEHSVLVYLHGIACCREQVLAASSRFNSRGYVIAAIDAREHYVRNDPDADECYSKWYGVSFFDFSSIEATGHRFALSASDAYALTLFLEQDLPGLLADLAAEQGLSQAPTVGPTHFMGHSLGGIIGTMTAALLPERFAEAGSALVDSAGGGGLAMIAFPTLWGGFLAEPMAEDQLQILLELETALAVGDPASHVPYLPIHHLIQEIEGDGTMPTATTELLAWTGGLPLLEPVAFEVPYLSTEPTPTSGNMADGRTAGLAQYVGDDHNFLYNQADQAMGQARLFMEQAVIYDAAELPEEP